MKRIISFLLALILTISISAIPVSACNEEQTNTYVTQILFGDRALSKSSDENVKKLMSALYLCCEQSDGGGQDKVRFLKSKKVSKISSLDDYDIKSKDLFECSHNSWEYESKSVKTEQDNRRKLLRNTVNDIFDFGFFNNWFRSSSGKCNSFSALLYYSHILADYLADDPDETESVVDGKVVSSFAGQAHVVLNGDKPRFSIAQKRSTESFLKVSELDRLGRAGVAWGNIGPEILDSVQPRDSNKSRLIRPTGLYIGKDSNNNKYKELIGSENDLGAVYERCHLIAHALGGQEEEKNFVTGTRYLNHEGMKNFEDNVIAYIKRTKNHVLYRVTPIFKDDNMLCSGVQLEAYSVEDSGKGICFNVYCYNVQPGIDINYTNGKNDMSDLFFNNDDKIIPFATQSANDGNPDLIYEINKHLDILFEDQKDSNTYISLQNEITTIAREARAVGNRGESAAKQYIVLNQYKYRYFNVLKSYIPVLLQKESFFKNVFK